MKKKLKIFLTAPQAILSLAV